MKAGFHLAGLQGIGAASLCSAENFFKQQQQIIGAIHVAIRTAAANVFPFTCI
jgi:hypothetical protein